MIEKPQNQETTPVDTTRESNTPQKTPDWLSRRLAKTLENQLFVGNAGALKYEYLGRNGDELDGKHYTLTSAVGSKVGVHEYAAQGENINLDIVVLFFHGNLRPTRYLKDIFQPLVENGITIIGRDFVGYDGSSFVPNVDGALEIAALANDEAVINWTLEKYSKSRIVICGRSMGTLGLAGHLARPRVIGAIGIVPVTSLDSLVDGLVAVLPRPLSGLVSLLGYPDSIAHAAFPRGFRSTTEPRIVSSGFASDFTGVARKLVFLFPADEDEFVPKGQVDLFRRGMEEKGCRVDVSWLKGGHHALPTSDQLIEALEALRDHRV
jgi:dienelactone hydrolase